MKEELEKLISERLEELSEVWIPEADEREEIEERIKTLKKLKNALFGW